MHTRYTVIARQLYKLCAYQVVIEKYMYQATFAIQSSAFDLSISHDILLISDI